MLAVVAIAFHFAISIFNVGALHGQTGDPLLWVASRIKGPLLGVVLFCVCVLALCFAASALMLLLVLLLSVGGEVAVGLWWLGGGDYYYHCYC